MDSHEMQQKFDAITMAILLGHITTARSAFKISKDGLNQSLNLDQWLRAKSVFDYCDRAMNTDF